MNMRKLLVLMVALASVLGFVTAASNQEALAQGHAKHHRVTSPTTTASPAQASTTLAEDTQVVGDYDGWHDTTGVNAFYTWLGYSSPSQKPEYAHEFVDHRYGWSPIASGACTCWTNWVAADNANRRLIVSLPLLTTSSAGDFAGLKNGAYDTYFKQFASKYKGTVASDVIVRLGWEMNGNTFPWAVPPNKPQALSDYKAGFNRVASIMKSADPDMKIDWEPNIMLNYTNQPFEQLYPGDTYVDYIGLGMYDYDWPAGSSDPGFQARWNWLQHPIPSRADDNGMIHHANFAAAHGKPMAFTEWGLWPNGNNGGGGDDPSFIHALAQWMRSHNTHHQAYNNNSNHLLDSYPNSKAAYKQEFGAS